MEMEIFYSPLDKNKPYNNLKSRQKTDKES